MAEVVTSVVLIVTHNPISGETTVVNTTTVGSDDPLDTRTRDAVIEPREVSLAEKAETLSTFLSTEVANGGSAANL